MLTILHWLAESGEAGCPDVLLSWLEGRFVDILDALGHKYLAVGTYQERFDVQVIYSTPSECSCSSLHMLTLLVLVLDPCQATQGVFSLLFTTLYCPCLLERAASR